VTEATCGFTCWLISKSEVGLGVIPVLVSGVEQEGTLLKKRLDCSEAAMKPSRAWYYKVTTRLLK
jgi:hypothetical protein